MYVSPLVVINCHLLDGMVCDGAGNGLHPQKMLHQTHRDALRMEKKASPTYLSIDRVATTWLHSRPTITWEKWFRVTSSVSRENSMNGAIHLVCLQYLVQLTDIHTTTVSIKQYYTQFWAQQQSIITPNIYWSFSRGIVQCRLQLVLMDLTAAYGQSNTNSPFEIIINESTIHDASPFIISIIHYTIQTE